MVLEEWGVIDATARAYWMISGEETYPLISYIMVGVMASIIAASMLPCTHRNKSTILRGTDFGRYFLPKSVPWGTDFGKKGLGSQNRSGQTNFGSKSGSGGPVLAGFSAKISPAGPILGGPTLA